MKQKQKAKPQAPTCHRFALRTPSVNLIWTDIMFPAHGDFDVIWENARPVTVEDKACFEVWKERIFLPSVNKISDSRWKFIPIVQEQWKPDQGVMEKPTNSEAPGIKQNQLCQNGSSECSLRLGAGQPARPGKDLPSLVNREQQHKRESDKE